MHEKKIDLVISGINAGQNIGDDVLYSGTVAVAVEAMCLGFKAIAISITSYEDQFFETASTIIDKLVDLQIYDLIGHRQLININVPNLPLSEIKGFVFAKQALDAIKTLFIKIKTIEIRIFLDRRRFTNLGRIQ